jgi:hypothetical protein
MRWVGVPRGRENEEEDDEDEEEGEDAEHLGREPQTAGQIGRQAVLKLLAGTAVCAFFSDPMVDSVSSFSEVRPPEKLLELRR